MVDARITQTQAVLGAAILELAAERPISLISVSDITREAGINRATFYNHFASAGALLASVISTNLDDIRTADHELHEEGVLRREEIAKLSIIATVELVERYRAVFEHSLLDVKDASLHRALSAHFEVSSRQHLERFAQDSEPVVDAAIVARFVAEGIVGAIEAWLANGEPTVEAVTDAIVSAMPRWWH